MFVLGAGVVFGTGAGGEAGDGAEDSDVGLKNG